MTSKLRHCLCTAALAVTGVFLTACSSTADDDQQAVEDWLATISLPRATGEFQLAGLQHYENQVIAALQMPRSNPLQAESGTDAFDKVSAAVCELPNIAVIWDAQHEFYASVKTGTGEDVLTVQTKRFDCCVIAKMATRSRQDAINQCPYEE
ncbi:MAG: hypothetical protein AAGA44_16270 [Pseudomonadota bacterium]